MRNHYSGGPGGRTCSGYALTVQFICTNETGLKDIKVSELRQRLPEYLARVRRGERLRVTSRGKVIAEIAPPAAPRDEIAAARARLRGSLRRYDNPLDPVIAPEEWDVNR